MTSVSSNSESSFVTPSTKPWFFTYNPEFQEVLIWKNGSRMKLSNGTTSGPVTEVAVKDVTKRILTLKGFSIDKDQRYGWHCHLDKFMLHNDFCEKLALVCNDPRKFCSELSMIVKGGIKYEDSPSKHPTSASIPPCKRRGSNVDIGAAKKRKLTNMTSEEINQLQEEIPEHHIGTYNVPFALLRPPPEYLRVRDVKEWYVEYLAKVLVDEIGDHEDLASPLLVICSVSKEDFKPKNIGQYTFEVIGGIQRFYAIKKINEKDSCMMESRKCTIYGKGITRHASLVLARQHNDCNQIQRSTSFSEVAACCRRFLFSHFANGASDDGVTHPLVPRYNSQAYRVYKQECLTFLRSPNMSQAMIEQAIQMALLRGPIYHKMQEVFLNFENGKLKGQKIREMKGATLQKALEGKLAPKLQHFKTFQGLEDVMKEELLDGLLNGELSFFEVERRSEELKGLATAKHMMLDEVELATWEEAEATIPKFTNPDLLKKFKLRNGKQPPKAFKIFCEKARVAKEQSTSTVQTVAEGTHVQVLAGSLVHMPLDGAEVIVLNLTAVSSGEELEEMINSVILNVSGCTLAMYGIHASPNPSEIEALCNTCGAECSRTFTVSAIEKTVGDVSIATSKEVVVAWWGPKPLLRGHILAEKMDVDSIICHPEEEDTVLTTQQAIGWMNLLITTPCPQLVVDIYSNSGELSQLCMTKGINCICIQASKALAIAVATNMGLPLSREEGEEGTAISAEPQDTQSLLGAAVEGLEHTNPEPPQDTEALLVELSEAEKMHVPVGGEEGGGQDQGGHGEEVGGGSEEEVEGGSEEVGGRKEVRGGEEAGGASEGRQSGEGRRIGEKNVHKKCVKGKTLGNKRVPRSGVRRTLRGHNRN